MSTDSPAVTRAMRVFGLALEIERLRSVNAALVEALEEFIEAAMYDPMMEGPRFKGWNRSALDRALPKARAAIAAAKTRGD